MVQVLRGTLAPKLLAPRRARSVPAVARAVAVLLSAGLAAVGLAAAGPGALPAGALVDPASQDPSAGSTTTDTVIPPEAQRAIGAVRRTGPSSNAELLAALAPLEELGLSRDEAMRIGLGRFPIAGPARWTHDWLLPRGGPSGFRYHLGCDVVAPYGTPVRAPVDGVATSSSDALGGLTVRITMADGTRFAMAHLAELADGFEQGMQVTTGDIVAFVGDSGNARGTPHVHLAVYPQGGAPVDPKPILDQFVADAEARLPQVIEVARANAESARQAREAPITTLPLEAASAARAATSPADGTADASGGPHASLSTAVVFAVGANPANGTVTLMESVLSDVAREIDWVERSAAISPATRVAAAAVADRWFGLVRARLRP